jgi:hypothetical protein
MSDIVLVSLDSARDAFESGDPGQWADFALKISARSPKCSSKWRDAHEALELELKRAVDPPPPAYF